MAVTAVLSLKMNRGRCLLEAHVRLTLHRDCSPSDGEKAEPPVRRPPGLPPPVGKKSVNLIVHPML